MNAASTAKAQSQLSLTSAVCAEGSEAEESEGSSRGLGDKDEERAFANIQGRWRGAPDATALVSAGVVGLGTDVPSQQLLARCWHASEDVEENVGAGGGYRRFVTKEIITRGRGGRRWKSPTGQRSPIVIKHGAREGVGEETCGERLEESTSTWFQLQVDVPTRPGDVSCGR